MAFALDHVFILTGAGAPEAEDLIRFGLVEGTPNFHLGQGTANRRFFFQNAMLELLWVSDPEEVRSVPASQLSLWERWQGRDHCLEIGFDGEMEGRVADFRPTFPLVLSW